MALAVLFTACVVGGYLASRLRLPPLLGMLLAGIVVGNLPDSFFGEVPDRWSLGLRLVALTVILLRAGLGLDLDALAGLRGSLARLAFLPNLAEASTVAIVAMLLLDMSLVWGLLLGFVVAAVSPAVVVPSLLDLQLRGYGTKKGIPTMVLAAATFDDVLSITGFGAMLGLVFADLGGGGVGASLIRAPIELGLGLGFGVAAGSLCGAARRLPAWLRFGVLAVAGLAAVGGGWALGFAGGGSLGAMTIGAVAARSWGDASAPVAAGLSRVWVVAQPLLFGLIGAAVALDVLEPSYVWSGLVILTVGLIVRLAATYASVSGDRFSTKERGFIALAWIPKATVQAAIGALALDAARQTSAGAQAEIHGTQVVTIAVLAILITAPIGAAAIAWTGPRWLAKGND